MYLNVVIIHYDTLGYIINLLAPNVLESIKCICGVVLNWISMTDIHSATLKVIQGGRITIPQEVREIENIQEGDYVKVTIEKIDRQNKQ